MSSPFLIRDDKGQAWEFQKRENHDLTTLYYIAGTPISFLVTDEAVRFAVDADALLYAEAMSAIRRATR